MDMPSDVAWIAVEYAVMEVSMRQIRRDMSIDILDSMERMELIALLEDRYPLTMDDFVRGLPAQPTFGDLADLVMRKYNSSQV